jgi:hypothetical protein
LAISVVALIVALTGAAVVTTLYLVRDRVTPDEKYLAALKAAWLSSQFDPDANAIAKGRQVCRQMNDRGPQQGMPADRVAVDHYCPHFGKVFTFSKGLP